MLKEVFGFTSGGVKEVCRWEGLSKCPRHVTHLGEEVKHINVDIAEEYVNINPMSVFEDADESLNSAGRVMFKTVHGSHLYGLNHDASDVDFYVVVEDGKGKHFKAKQSIVDGVDSTVVGYNSFMEMCFKGVPQALEAMFSSKATVDEFKALRQAYRAGGSSVTDVYLRTIFNFSRDRRRGGLKYKKHAVRLALNLNSILDNERFNPTLTDKEIKLVTELYVLPQEEFEEKLNSVSFIQIFN